MERHKYEFIDFLVRTGALKLTGDKELKNKRLSPYFINMGNFNDGNSTIAMGSAYAGAIINHFGNEIIGNEEGLLLYGIPEKGIALAIATAEGLARECINVPWFFTRKFAKTVGEATGTQSFTVGRTPKDGNRIIQLDDVFTAGTAKYEAREELMGLGKFDLPLLAIAADRQEVGTDGTNAIEKYEEDTGTKVTSIVTATDILDYLRERPDVGDSRSIERIENYLRAYGTATARKGLSPLEQKIIGRERSIIPACDMDDLDDFEDLVRQTADIDGIGGYKIGFQLGLRHGLSNVVKAAKKNTDKPIIYDHQKAGTDIPDTGKNFASTMKDAGVDTIILFPQAGPETERAWIYHALDHGLNIIMGGRMTHPAYAQSEGGFITDKGAMEMYRIAARAGINHFVVPGNKLDVIKEVKAMVEAEGVKPVLYSPGFVAQLGSITDATKVAGESWHAIVGRAIVNAPGKDYKKAALTYVSQL